MVKLYTYYFVYTSMYIFIYTNRVFYCVVLNKEKYLIGECLAFVCMYVHIGTKKGASEDFSLSLYMYIYIYRRALKKHVQPGAGPEKGAYLRALINAP